MKQSGWCFNIIAFFIFTAILSIVTDLWVLVLPIPLLRTLHIKTKDKLILYGLFGIGAFAVAVSCVRLWAIYSFILHTDPSREVVSVQANLWSMIEINSAIACANIPALKPLFRLRYLHGTIRTRRAANNERFGNGYHEIGPRNESEHSQSERHTPRVTRDGKQRNGQNLTLGFDESINLDSMPRTCSRE
ncbi:hypothetical protein AB5N19_09925 [Seiridium cardinale]